MARGCGLLGAVLGTALAVTLVTADDGLHLEAKVQGGFSQRATSIQIEGAQVVIRDVRQEPNARTEVRLRLEPDEVALLDEALEASRFFEDWTEAVSPCDASTWSVDVQIGGQRRERSSVPSATQPEFRPLETFLWRLVHQVELVADLRDGSGRWAVSRIRHAPRDHVLRWSALAPDVIEAANHREDKGEAAEIARVLVRLSTPAAWEEDAARFLRALNPALRAGALDRWQREIDEAGLEAFQPAQTALALARMEAWWARGPKIDAPERWDYDHVLERLLQDGEPRAFVLAESIARDWSTHDVPVLPGGIAYRGAAAVGSAARLLAEARPEPRAAGAALALELTEQAVGRPRPWAATSEERAAIRAGLTHEVAPLLERIAADTDQPRVLRENAWRALDLLAGRDRAAERREAERRRRDERARSSPRPPITGPLAIRGRVLADGDVAVAGLRVRATRTDGALGSASGTSGEDGSFLLEGLAPGPHRLVAVQSNDRPFRRGERGLDEVDAGAEDVVLRLPGTFLRGRLLDARNRAVAARRVFARMRDPPSYLQVRGVGTGGVAETNTDGTFLIPFLLRGIYDVQVMGHDAVAGGAGLESGSPLHTVRMLEGRMIRGRVTDEEGAPFSEVRVTAWPEDDRQQYLHVRQAADGTFEIPGLVASRRYTIGASLTSGAPPYRSASIVAVAEGEVEVELPIRTAPWVRVVVDAGSRPVLAVRLTRVAGGSPCQFMFQERRIRLPAAPGTWKVQGRVRDRDAKGDSVLVWIELGQVEGGDPEQSLVVPP